MLGNLIAEDGNKTLGIIYLNDSYGTGLAKYVTEAFEAAGGEVVAAPSYNTGDTVVRRADRRRFSRPTPTRSR